ncbi:MAG TPA: tripartite tricarboxylate transporter TctB family protein [Burkholderiales bacterium]|nr:tripartite tricarboxylate transporter TctB family protein [Burkholderiales bacterium]
MSDDSHTRPAFRYKTAELAMAGFFIVLGLVVIFDSVRLGATWGENGPRPGYFPFYLGVLICLSSGITFVRGLYIRPDKNRTFVEVGQLKLVLSVLVPTAIYVVLVGWLGIYVASALYVALFMRWLGRYPWWMVALISIGNSVAFFLIFEIWFLVPLPKGPLEVLLGLA